MSFSDHKITAFTHRISDLPDQPNLPADELKARFDSSPEELRESVNGICDDADRLEERVSGIIAETFGDTIDKSMLSDELQDELDAKAVASTVAEQLEAETEAREAADTTLQSSISSMQTTVAAKCEVYIGSYQGNGASGQSNSQYIGVGFAPRAVIVFNQNGTIDNNGYAYGGVASSITGNSPCVRLSGTGFVVYNHPTQADLNQTGMSYGYIAFK